MKLPNVNIGALSVAKVESYLRRAAKPCRWQ